MLDIQRMNTIVEDNFQHYTVQKHKDKDLYSVNCNNLYFTWSARGATVEKKMEGSNSKDKKQNQFLEIAYYDFKSVHPNLGLGYFESTCKLVKYIFDLEHQPTQYSEVPLGPQKMAVALQKLTNIVETLATKPTGAR